MNTKRKRKVGAPYGNRNALKHGFYSRNIRYSKIDLKQAASVQSIDEEIALLRVKIKNALACNPDNLQFLTQATASLNRLLHTKNKLDLASAVAEAVKAIVPSLFSGMADTPQPHHHDGGEE